MDPDHTEQLISALQILMLNNIIQFGDTYRRQITGSATGISPAPPWAIIFYAIHKQDFVPHWSNNLLLWRCFIDDGIGFWQRHPDPKTNADLWKDFKRDVGDLHELEWEFAPLSQSNDFMDLNIIILNDDVEITLFEKKLNLCLYIM
jgi:hypothetical protein